VLPTTLPLAEFYRELVSTQAVLNRKHLGWSAVKSIAAILARNLARGQTNTLKMLWKFNGVYNPSLQLSDHERPVRYQLAPPPEHQISVARNALYVHHPGGHSNGVLDKATQSFVNATRSTAEPAAVASNGAVD
jgi:hypothetical protein